MVDYFSFEDVMGELEVSEEDLKRMVSEGELRAFRDENKMKFRKEDVENLKKGRITEPTIILPSTPGGGQDETVLDLDISTETASLRSQGADPRAATDTGDDDLLINTGPRDDESVVGVETDDTFIEEDSDTGLTTEPLQLVDEVESAETVESEPVTEEIAEGPRKGRSRVGRRVTAQLPMATEEEIEKRRASPVWTVLLLLTLVAGLYSGITAFDLLRLENGIIDQPSSLTAGIGEWTLKQFWGDPKWTEFHTRKFPENGSKAPPFEFQTGSGVTIKHTDYAGPSFMESDLPKGASPVQ